jgi:uncharacterized RDD family membrane protein YckC
MKPRFELDNQGSAGQESPPSLVDPEAYDASEQAFAASLEQTVSSRPPRFVVEEEISAGSTETIAEPHLQDPPHNDREPAGVPETAEGESSEPPSAKVAADPESWRREVADRLSHYRARRRPREPRYPSLQLKFESEPVWNRASSDAPASETDPALSSVRLAPNLLESERPAGVPRIRLAEAADFPRALFSVAREATAKVIEFASYSAPARPFDELAEPVMGRPRIVEAPDLVPPPPALGGISIEPVEEPANERRPGFEIPLQAAPMGRRMAAAAIDAGLVMTAVVAFAYIFFRMTVEPLSFVKVAGTAVFLAAGFWCAYQYLLLVYSGTTPGLKLAKLELQRFDGDPVPRRLRRWRVLASALSGVSLGLGYAWCLLDEDELCWHDRITRTYMAPRK